MLQPLQDFLTTFEYNLIKIIEITVFLVQVLVFVSLEIKAPAPSSLC